MIVCAESPRWLLKAGHRDESLAILARLRSDDGEVNDEALAEFNEIDETMRIDGGEEPSYLTMLFRSCGKLHLSRRVRFVSSIRLSSSTCKLTITPYVDPTCYVRSHEHGGSALSRQKRLTLLRFCLAAGSRSFRSGAALRPSPVS